MATQKLNFENKKQKLNLFCTIYIQDLLLWKLFKLGYITLKTYS